MSDRESLLKPFTQIMFIQNWTSNISQLSIHNHIFLGMQIIYCFCILLPLTSKLNLNCTRAGGNMIAVQDNFVLTTEARPFRMQTAEGVKVILAD